MRESESALFSMISHMRGHIADMDAVTALCEKHGVTLIEDCAHTMGALLERAQARAASARSAASARKPTST